MIYSYFTKLLKRFSVNNHGNFAVITALSLLPLMVAVGSAVDYSRTYEHKSFLQGVLDSATLAAAVEYEKTGNTENSEKHGVDVFFSNCLIPDCEKDILPVVKIENDKVTGTYSAKLDTYFVSIMGVTEISFDLATEVKVSNSYLEYHFVIDVSESLGNASGKTNIARLEKLTKPFEKGFNEGCAFACHTRQGWEPSLDKNGNLYRILGNGSIIGRDFNGNPIVPNIPNKPKQLTMLEIARLANIPIRADIIQQETEEAMSKILSEINGKHADQIKVGVYAMSEDWQMLSKPTTNSGNLISSMKEQKITIKRKRSHFDTVLPSIAADIGMTGSGTSKNDRKKTVIIVTDGVRNNLSDKKKQFQAFDASWCDDFKSNGVRVVVLHIEYPEVNGSKWWRSTTRDLLPPTKAQLKLCASDGMYYTSGDDANIAATLVKMSKEALQQEMALSK